MVFATQNPASGAYGGRKLLSKAFRNRFIEIYVQELPVAELQTILETRCALPASLCKSMVEIYSELRARRLKSSVFESSSSFMTIRDLLRWGHRRPGTREELAEEGYFLIGERLRDPDEKEELKQLLEKKCIGRRNGKLTINFMEDHEVLKTLKQLRSRPELENRLVFTPPMARLVALVQRCLRHHEPVLLVGETGAGKTSVCQLLAALHGRPLRIVNCHQQTETSDLLGCVQPVKDRGSVWSACVACGEALLEHFDRIRTSSTLEPLNKAGAVVGSRDVGAVHKSEALEGQQLLNGRERVLEAFAVITRVVEALRQCAQQGDGPQVIQTKDQDAEKVKEEENINERQAALLDVAMTQRVLNSLLSGFEEACAVLARESQREDEDSVKLDTQDTVYSKFKGPCSSDCDAAAQAPLAKRRRRGAVSLGDGASVLAPQEARLPEALESALVWLTGLRKKSEALIRALQNTQKLFEWEDGPLVRCMQDGGYLVLDEISLAEDATLERLNSVLEPNGVLFLTEKGGVQALKTGNTGVSGTEVVRAAPGFRIIATMNPGGDFGKRELSPALRNRFTEIWVPAVDFKNEDAFRLIAQKIGHGLSADWVASLNISGGEDVTHALAQAMQTVVAWYNTQVRFPLSVREVLAWIDFLRASFSKFAFLPARRSAETAIVEFFVHGGCLVLVDGFACGNALAFNGQIVSSDKPAEHFELCVIERLLLVAQEILCPCLKGVDMKVVASQFSNSGFAWIEASLDDFLHAHRSLLSRGMESCSVAFAEGAPCQEEKLDYWRLGPFALPCRHGSARSDQTIENFAFGAPTTAANLGRVLRGLELNRSILLEGPPGAGKTSLIQALADLSGHELVRINLSEQTDLIDLLGSDLPSTQRSSMWGSTAGTIELRPKLSGDAQSLFRWVDGALLRAMKKGHWVLLDELNLATQQVLEGLNALLDHRREVYLPQLDLVVRCSPNFRLFAAQNPISDGGGRKGLPRSFVNRFTRISVKSMGEADFKVALQAKYKQTIPVPIQERVLRLMESIRNASKNREISSGACWEWNLRDVFRLCTLIARRCPTFNSETSASVLLASRLSTPKDVGLMHQLIDHYLGEKMWNTDPLQHRQERVGFSVQFRQRVGLLLKSCLASQMSDSGQDDNREIKILRVEKEGFKLPLRSALKLARAGPARLGDAVCLIDFDKCLALFNRSRNGIVTSEHNPVDGMRLYSQADAAVRVAYAVQCGFPTLIVGPCGSGKASLVRHVARIVGIPLKEMTLTSSMDVTELLGTYEPENCLSHWDTVLNLLQELVSWCGWPLCLASQADPKMTFTMKSLFDAIVEHLTAARIIRDACQQGQLLNNKVQDLLTKVQTWIRDASLICVALRSCEKRQEFPALFSAQYVEGFHRHLTALQQALNLLKTASHRQVNSSKSKSFETEAASTQIRFRWTDSQLLESVEKGDWILLRRIHFASAALLDRLNSLLEPNGFLLLTECGKPEMIRPHPNFRVFFTSDNSEEAQSKLSRALRNRCIEISIATDHNREQHEEEPLRDETLPTTALLVSDDKVIPHFPDVTRVWLHSCLKAILYKIDPVAYSLEIQQVLECVRQFCTVLGQPEELPVSVRAALSCFVQQSVDAFILASTVYPEGHYNGAREIANGAMAVIYGLVQLIVWARVAFQNACRRSKENSREPQGALPSRFFATLLQFQMQRGELARGLAEHKRRLMLWFSSVRVDQAFSMRTESFGAVIGCHFIEAFRNTIVTGTVESHGTSQSALAADLELFWVEVIPLLYVEATQCGTTVSAGEPHNVGTCFFTLLKTAAASGACLETFRPLFHPSEVVTRVIGARYATYMQDAIGFRMVALHYKGVKASRHDNKICCNTMLEIQRSLYTAVTLFYERMEGCDLSEWIGRTHFIESQITGQGFPLAETMRGTFLSALQGLQKGSNVFLRLQQCAQVCLEVLHGGACSVSLADAPVFIRSLASSTSPFIPEEKRELVKQCERLIHAIHRLFGGLMTLRLTGCFDKVRGCESEVLSNGISQVTPAKTENFEAPRVVEWSELHAKSPLCLWHLRRAILVACVPENEGVLSSDTCIRGGDLDYPICPLVRWVASHPAMESSNRFQTFKRTVLEDVFLSPCDIQILANCIEEGVERSLEKLTQDIIGGIERLTHIEVEPIETAQQTVDLLVQATFRQLRFCIGCEALGKLDAETTMATSLVAKSSLTEMVAVSDALWEAAFEQQKQSFEMEAHLVCEVLRFLSPRIAQSAAFVNLSPLHTVLEHLRFKVKSHSVFAGCLDDTQRILLEESLSQCLFRGAYLSQVDFLIEKGLTEAFRLGYGFLPTPVMFGERHVVAHYAEVLGTIRCLRCIRSTNGKSYERCLDILCQRLAPQCLQLLTSRCDIPAVHHELSDGAPNKKNYNMAGSLAQDVLPAHLCVVLQMSRLLKRLVLALSCLAHIQENEEPQFFGALTSQSQWTAVFRDCRLFWVSCLSATLPQDREIPMVLRPLAVCGLYVAAALTACEWQLGALAPFTRAGVQARVAALQKECSLRHAELVYSVQTLTRLHIGTRKEAEARPLFDVGDGEQGVSDHFTVDHTLVEVLTQGRLSEEVSISKANVPSASSTYNSTLHGDGARKEWKLQQLRRIALPSLNVDTTVAWAITLPLSFCSKIPKQLTLKRIAGIRSAALRLQQILNGGDDLVDQFVNPLIQMGIAKTDQTVPLLGQDWHWICDSLLEMLLFHLTRLGYRGNNEGEDGVLTARRFSCNEDILRLAFSKSAMAFVLLEQRLNVEKSSCPFSFPALCVVRDSINSALTFVATGRSILESAADNANDAERHTLCLIAACNLWEVVMRQVLESLEERRLRCLEDEQKSLSQFVWCARSKLLFMIEVYRLANAKEHLGSAARRDWMMSLYKKEADYQALSLAAEGRVRELQDACLTGDLYGITGVTAWVQTQGQRLRALEQELAHAVPLRPPLNTEGEEDSRFSPLADIYATLERTGAVVAQNQSVGAQLERLREELDGFVTAAWSPQRLEAECPWLLGVDRDSRVILSADGCLNSEECLSNPKLDWSHTISTTALVRTTEYIAFLFQATAGFLQSMARSYPLLPDVLDPLALSFYTALRALADCYYVYLKEHGIVPTVDKMSGDDHAEGNILESPISILPEDPCTKSIDRCLWECFAFEHALRNRVLSAPSTGRLMHSLCQLAADYTQDKKKKLALEAQKFARYIQEQGPEGRGTADTDEAMAELSAKYFPQGTFTSEEAFEDLLLSTPLSRVDTHDERDIESWEMSKMLQNRCGLLDTVGQQAPQQHSAPPAEQINDWNMKPFQAERFLDVLGNLCKTLTSPGKKLSQNLSCVEPEWNFHMTSLGFLLKEKAGYPLFSEGPSNMFSNISILTSLLLRRQLAVLQDAMTTESLTTRFSLLFEKDGEEGKCLLMDDDDEDHACNNETFVATPGSKAEDDIDAALLIARRRHAKYRSQKVRYLQIQRILRDSRTRVIEHSQVSSFYADAWPAACVSIYPAVVALADRVDELLHKDFQDHPALLKIKEMVETISDLPVFKTTTISLVNALELLMGRCEKWEPFAHRGVSLRNFVAPIRKHLLLLRHQQLSDWKDLRNFRENNEAREAYSWGPELLITLEGLIDEDMPQELKTASSGLASSQTTDGSKTTVSTLPLSDLQKLWSYLEQTVLSKSIGSFETRLQLIQCFSLLYQSTKPATARRSALAHLLGHFSVYARLLLPKVDAALTQARRDMDREIRDLLKILRWDFTRPEALRVSIQKGHYQLGKAIKKFDAFIQEPVIGHVSSSTQQLAPPGVLNDLGKNPSVLSYDHQKDLSKRVLAHVLCGDIFHKLTTKENRFQSVEWLTLCFERRDVQSAARTRYFDIFSVNSWLQCLASDVEAALDQVQIATSTHKKRWILTLRDKLKKEFKLTPLARDANLDIVLSPTGLVSPFDVFSSQLFSETLTPEPQVTQATPADDRDIFSAYTLMVLRERQKCVGGVDLRQFFSSAGALWTFARDSVYRQIRRYTALQGLLGQCHSDLITDESHRVWLGFCGALLEKSQHHVMKVWTFSNRVAHLLDLIIVARRPIHCLDPDRFNLLFNVLDAAVNAIQHFSLFFGTVYEKELLDSCETQPLFETTRAVSGSTNECLREDSCRWGELFTSSFSRCGEDQLKKTLDILFQLLQRLREALCLSPEIHIFRRTHGRVCVLTKSLMEVLIHASQWLNVNQKNVKSILEFNRAPMAARQSLFATLSKAQEVLKSVTVTQDNTHNSESTCGLQNESFSSPTVKHLPTLSSLVDAGQSVVVECLSSKDVVEMSETDDPQIVDFSRIDAIYNNFPLEEIIQYIEADLQCPTIAKLMDQNDALESLLGQACTAVLIGLDASTGTGGLGILISKRKLQELLHIYQCFTSYKKVLVVND